MTMSSNNNGLANRSFLYSSACASTSSTVDKIVYATLDGLTLRPLSLQVDSSTDVLAVKPKLSALSPKGNSSSVSSESSHDASPGTPSAKPNLQEIGAVLVYPRIVVQKNAHNGAKNHPRQLESEDSDVNLRSSGSSIHGYTFPGLAKQKSKHKAKKESVDNAHKKERKEFTFAKNVLHYVPMTSRRYYRKSRKLASKSLSLKSLAGHREESNIRTPKSRTLSKDELKYITISTPSNFVHVASATRSNLMGAAGQGRPDEDKRKRSVINHEEKYADLRGGEYAEIRVDKTQESSPVFVVNESFLWSRLTKVKETEELNGCDDDDYDDVGPPVIPESHAIDGPASHDARTSSTLAEEAERPTGQEDQDTYDDVGPPLHLQENAISEEQVYDDVGPPQETPVSPSSAEKPADAEDEAIIEKVELRVTSVEEEDDDVYDDVGPPVILQAITQECHERVNSLYAGSSVAGSIYQGCNVYDKESEWEDLEDSGVYGINAGSKSTNDCSQSTSATTPSKKKSCGGPRWSCKVRRQRSKASRKSSGRSTSRTRTRPQLSSTPVSRSNLRYSVAVSLGTGSVLLLGSCGQDDETQNVEKDENRKEEEEEERRCKGLLQMRLLVEDDGQHVQETSLYVAEDSSDDSNYETLQSYELDDFSSDSEAEESSSSANPTTQALQKPPNRPIPPPPREESLGHTFGRRMKMLRRTWSITKGSLGRMRRRASDEFNPQNSISDARKYFSFKKHFRKSQSTGLSTFYLDKGSSSGNSEKENGSGNEKEEAIYSNSNWYKEVGLYREEETSVANSEEPVMDHYSVLAEEPLYQFYAAAATRVAFESDSDGYEEVEELTPSSATTDLARPGHRTLWCQTPQIMNSGLLQSLTMEERKIQEAKFEILTSEASYLNSLRVLENEFASNHELVHEILTPAERDKLFGSVPDVLVASERFLAELETIWREDPMLDRLPELLLKHGEKSAQVYIDYCSNQVSIDTSLKELKAKKGYRFLETVSKIEMHPTCHSLSLHSFLMLPMQRITRLPLLADAVLSKLSVEHNERLSWERVLASLSQIVAKCNEAARLAERRNEMESLARKLEYPVKVPPVDLRNRELIRSGTVVQLSTKSDTEYKLTFGKKFHKTPLMLMLLTDYLLVTKLKHNSNEETFTVMESCKRSLVALEAAPEDSPFAGRHAMVLTLLENHAGRQVEYVVTCENDTEKERWLDAVSPPKPTCVGETLYESWDCPQVMAVYSYAPRQPDELPLQPGDVINVLRKMNDGWLYGEKLLDGDQGWFPGNFTKEVASEHVRARNLRQRHRFLALSGSVLQRKAKQSLSLL